MADGTDEQEKLLRAFNATAGPTSTRMSASVEQSQALGVFRLAINGPNHQSAVYGSLDDLQRLLQQGLVDVARQRELLHVFWTPEVEV